MTTKAVTIVTFLLTLAFVAVMVGCKEGPAGPPGETTIVNLEGFAPGIKCATCHVPDTDTTYYVLARAYQWEQSKHANGGDLERNGGNCAGCHTTEGFIERMKNLAAGSLSQQVTDKWQPSPPGCFACHSPHLRGNFSLRDTTPVTVKTFIVGVSDQVFDYGRGNLCAKCHQTRTTSTLSPLPNPAKTATTDTITITSSRWYPHYGVQPQMFMGQGKGGGFEFQGYTFTGNSNHSTNSIIKSKGCPVCHMAEQVYSSTGGFPTNAGTGKGGGHTMNTVYHWPEPTDPESQLLTGCKDAACHGSTFSSFDYKGATTTPLNLGTRTAVQRYLDTLETMMLDTAVVNKFNVSTAKRPWLVLGAEGLGVNASSSAPLKIRPASRAGALWNYLFVEHDMSEGIHNTKYTIELLQASIAELRKP